MANWPVALKVYLNARKVYFSGHLEKPIESSIGVDVRNGVARRVTPPRSRARDVLAGEAHLEWQGGNVYQLSGVLTYADENGQLSDVPEDWTVLPNQRAGLEITILYDAYDGGETRSLVIRAQDPSPLADGDPFTPGTIDLFPEGFDGRKIPSYEKKDDCSDAE